MESDQLKEQIKNLENDLKVREIEMKTHLKRLQSQI